MSSQWFRALFSLFSVTRFQHPCMLQECMMLSSCMQMCKSTKILWHRNWRNIFDMCTMFLIKYFSQILAGRSTYVLCIPYLLWQPKGDNVKEETECERCPVQLAVRWKKMLHHKGSFAISLEWGSWCRMEIGWFTDMMVLWIKKNVSNHSQCWLQWTFTFGQISRK